MFSHFNAVSFDIEMQGKLSSKQLSCTDSELVGKIIAWAGACHKRNGLLLWEHLHQGGLFYSWKRQPFTKSCVLRTPCQLAESANSLTAYRSFLPRNTGEKL